MLREDVCRAWNGARDDPGDEAQPGGRIVVFGDFVQLKRDSIKILSTEEKDSLFYIKVTNRFIRG